MNSLPNDVRRLIADQLEPPALRAMSGVDRSWHRICADEACWQRFWRRDISEVVGTVRYGTEGEVLDSSSITYREAYLRAIRCVESFRGEPGSVCYNKPDITLQTVPAMVRGWEKVLEKQYEALDAVGKAHFIALPCAAHPEHVRLFLRKLRLARLVREANVFERAVSVARPVVGKVKCTPY